MKDRFFYPLMVIVIGSILALALLPGRETGGVSDQDVLKNGFVLSGSDLQKLAIAPGTALRFPNTQDGAFSYAVMSSNLPRKMAPPSAGIFGILGPKYERLFAEKMLKITVSARQGQDNPLDDFEMGYFTVGTGDSGWKTFELTPQFEDYIFTFRPKKNTEPDNDYIGIWPGVEGKSKTMEVRAIKVEIVASNGAE